MELAPKLNPTQNSTMDDVRSDIIHFVKMHPDASQEDILSSLNWPSVVVSFSLGQLTQEGEIEGYLKKGKKVFRAVWTPASSI